MSCLYRTSFLEGRLCFSSHHDRGKSDVHGFTGSGSGPGSWSSFTVATMSWEIRVREAQLSSVILKRQGKH